MKNKIETNRNQGEGKWKKAVGMKSKRKKYEKIDEKKQVTKKKKMVTNKETGKEKISNEIKSKENVK